MKSIIIPTYKHLDLLKTCISSIIEYTDLDDIEVIIVANGCGNDGTKEYVESLGKHFKLVWFDEGLGYTKATNEGVKASSGDILILLNNDIELISQKKNDWINFLCNPLKDNIGLTANLKIWDESVERMFGVFFCVATPRWLWDRIGGLDESWTPGGGEDIEYCIKVEQLGYKIIQVPDEHNQIINGINVNRFPLYHRGEGTMLDDEHKEMWHKHIVWVRNRLAEKYKLPPGWFYGEDINEYRQLVEDVPEGGVIAELGCYKGRSLCSVADIILRKNLRAVVVDIFTGTESELKENNYRKIFEDNIKRFGIFDKVVIHEGKTDDVINDFGGDGIFDLLFIDADHSYEQVKKDILNWIRTIRKHGKISGHDYGNNTGVSKAVNEIFTSGVRCNQLQFEIHSGIATSSVWSKRL